MSKRRTRERFIKAPTIRFQVEMLEARLPILEGLVAQTGIRTKRELFDNAFALLEWMVCETRNGNTVGSRGPNGKFREICMPFLSTTKAFAAVKTQKPPDIV